MPWLQRTSAFPLAVLLLSLGAELRLEGRHETHFNFTFFIFKNVNTYILDILKGYATPSVNFNPI